MCRCAGRIDKEVTRSTASHFAPVDARRDVAVLRQVVTTGRMYRAIVALIGWAGHSIDVVHRDISPRVTFRVRYASGVLRRQSIRPMRTTRLSACVHRRILSGAAERFGWQRAAQIRHLCGWPDHTKIADCA